MVKTLVAFVIGTIVSLAGTYFGIMALIFVLSGGLSDHAAGQAAMRQANGALQSFIAVAGPGFTDLLHTIGQSLQRLFDR